MNAEQPNRMKPVQDARLGAQAQIQVVVSSPMMIGGWTSHGAEP